MSTHGSRGHGTHGRDGLHRGAWAKPSSMGSIPLLDTNKTIGTLTIETEAGAQFAEDDALSQAMLRVLERVVGTHTRLGSRGLITE